LLLAFLVVITVMTAVRLKPAVQELLERASKAKKEVVVQQRRAELQRQEAPPKRVFGTRQLPSPPQYVLAAGPVPLRPWGGSRILELGIPPDLPLTWRSEDPLTFRLPDGAVLTCDGDVRKGILVFHGTGCRSLKVVLGGQQEERLIWIVKSYASDAVDIFRLNLAAHGIDLSGSLTVREASSALSASGLLSTKGTWQTLRVFEDSRYGEKEPRREEYESFLRGLFLLKDALVTGCKHEKQG